MVMLYFSHNNVLDKTIHATAAQGTMIETCLGACRSCICCLCRPALRIPCTCVCVCVCVWKERKAREMEKIVRMNDNGNDQRKKC